MFIQFIPCYQAPAAFIYMHNFPPVGQAIEVIC